MCVCLCECRYIYYIGGLYIYTCMCANISITRFAPLPPGSLVIPATVPRLPFGSNHLGISESTTVALLVLLMEMCTHSPDNAR